MRDPSEIRILIVEDDEIDQRAIVRAFKKIGITNPVTIANNGVEAFKIMKGESSEGLPRPNLVITDINMPEMDGIELIKKIRADELLKDTIVFVLTTSDSDQDVISSYLENVAGYIVKSDVGTDFINLVTMLEKVMITLRFPPER